NELSPRIIAIQMSNFYLNTDKNEAFIIVNKGIKGSVGQKMDIYYFKKIKNKWKYEGKDVLLQG
ncbi:hypothetical protein, partial [Kaistella sp.]|uniref:hypothetical protein n=1 Tax=Kaistella sp. TaxID=2782235 RepID=UPI003C5330D6